MSGDSGAASEWAVCTEPRPAGGLQRCPPRNWLSCPLAALCGVGGAGSGGGDHSVGTAPCCDGLDAVLPGLFIASGQAAARYGDLAACGVTHVVNAAPSVELCWHKQHLDYLVVDVLDGPDEPISAHFSRVNAYIAAARAAGGNVLVHCHGGVSRAATLVMAYLIGEEGLGYDNAWTLLRGARPVVSPNPGFVAQLRSFEAVVRASLPCDSHGGAGIASTSCCAHHKSDEGALDWAAPANIAVPTRCSTTAAAGSEAPLSTSSSLGPDTPELCDCGNDAVFEHSPGNTDIEEEGLPLPQPHGPRRASLPPYMPTNGSVVLDLTSVEPGAVVALKRSLTL